MTESTLFGVIGPKYGGGDGVTTFNLPDFRNRFMEGAGDNALGTHIEPGLPNITGYFSADNVSGSDPTGCVEIQNKYSNPIQTSSDRHNAFVYKINGSKGETKADGTLKTDSDHKVYGKSSTVQPDAVCVNYIIKY